MGQVMAQFEIVAGFLILLLVVFDKLCEAEYSINCCNSRMYRYLRFLAHLASVAP